MTSTELSPAAYSVLYMHCLKYPHRSVNGLLLGAADGDAVRVREALPLFHSSLALAPMLEAALLLADEYCAVQKLKIVGYYQANEVVDDLELPFPTTRPQLGATLGVRIPEATLLADATTLARAAANATRWRLLQRRLVRARRELSYRARGSPIATFALREAWAGCLQQRRSLARAPTDVEKC